ncbi:MAG: LuxR C-terminal-related transcriptional regulator [Tannerella sp.]|jgi:DNA-binding CsgD family transcriptional regulator|nr:LuxR C-terminal-related transcriptional regulator [Tannerella sp.]
MPVSKKIAIILSDTLQGVGLRSLLTDYFSPVEISLFFSFDHFLPSENDFFDFYFTIPDIFVVHTDFFIPKLSKTICIIHQCSLEPDPHLPQSYDLTALQSDPALSPQPVLIANRQQEEIIEQLRVVFNDRLSTSPKTAKVLSVREQDVLRLVVKGMINKEIAEKLYISLNTVLTHRKNITSKLGIKTVPGLTFYAIMHGLIPGNEIEL